MPIFAWLVARPTVIVGVGLVALLGVREVQHFFTIRGLRNDITKLEEKFDLELRKNAGLQLANDKANEGIAKLQSTIEDMNLRLDAMNARARQIEASANLRVARAIRAGEEAAKGLMAETTHVPPGHAEMNAWLAQRLGL